MAPDGSAAREVGVAPSEATGIALFAVTSAHCVIGAACSLAAVLLLHPVPAGRLVKASLWAAASVAIYFAVSWPLLGISMVIYLTATGRSLGPRD